MSSFVGRIDLANGNAAYGFASLSGQPVDLLIGLDGALYVLTRSAVTRTGALITALRSLPRCATSGCAARPQAACRTRAGTHG